MPETVWAIHNFEAEAEDEISFHIGEPIVVLQKDELYQDGWWEGTNLRGETGLFPQNYTAQSPPEQAPLVAPLREPNVYGGDPDVAGNNSKKIGNNAINLNSNANHINSSLNHNNHILDNNSINNNSNNNINSTGRVMSQQGQGNLVNGVNNMHIHQNPSIASPSMGSTRGSVASGLTGSTSNSKIIAQTVEESLTDPQLAGHPSTWSIDHVAYWLRYCGFDSVTSSFIDNEISGAILLELNLNNLKELDIASFGKRFNIMNAITSLKQLTKSSGSKSAYGTMSNASSMYGAGPNIPPRMTSAPIDGFSPRASIDSRADYMREPRQDLHDPRNAPLPPVSVQPPNIRSLPLLPSQPPPQQLPQQPPQQQFSNYDVHSSHSQSRSAALARSDTVGSALSGGSLGEYPGHTSSDAGYGGQRQSLTSAYSSNSNPQRNKWDQNVPRTPQVPNTVVEQQHPLDQYPRPMDRDLPKTPEILHADPYSNLFEQPVPKPRKYHNPDPSNRPQNGKADPSDKVVSLDLIGKPDYAGWLKKRGDTYRTWKSRWFMLKGVTLYYMNSPKDNASKDYINLIGYKIIQDENIYAGKYCFKAVHEELRNFYFYTESEGEMKGWLKALMKVTIGRDPSAPVISSSNIPTIPLHVARQMAPRPPSPSKRNRGQGPNGQPMHPQQLQHQQLYDQRIQQQQEQQRLQQLQQQKSLQQKLLDYDDQDSDGEDFLPDGYGSSPGYSGISGVASNTNGVVNDQTRAIEPPLNSIAQQQQQQQRHSLVQSDQHGDDDPWRDEDVEGFGEQQKYQKSQQQHQILKPLRPDSELDSFNHSDGQPTQGSSPRWTQEQYVSWINRNLPNTVDPVSDITQSLRSGVVLVRLIEGLSGEQVDKRIPNATYTLQMLENLLTGFKFMDRVGVSTDGYTVKDIFNGNEEKIIVMFEAIRARFPKDSEASIAAQAQQAQSSHANIPANVAAQLPPMPNGPAPTTPISQLKGSPRLNNSNPEHVSPARSNGRSPLIGGGPAMFAGNTQSHPMQAQHSSDSEYAALYDEAARSTIS
ncbi:polar growth protein [Mortierella sp. AM989]|nr:polar growth protein [Mortierella sp. AM989]